MPNFRALKITKHYIVNDITQKITTVEREGKKTFAELRGRETQALPRIFTFFWIPPPPLPPKKNKQTNKQKKTFLPPTWNKPPNAKNPGIENFKPLLQVNARGKLSPCQLRRLAWSHITEFSKSPWTVAFWYSTCMCDKLATSACGFYLQRAINFISKCGALSRVLNLAGQWKGSLPRRRF